MQAHGWINAVTWGIIFPIVILLAHSLRSANKLFYGLISMSSLLCNSMGMNFQSAKPQVQSYQAFALLNGSKQLLPVLLHALRE